MGRLQPLSGAACAWQGCIEGGAGWGQGRTLHRSGMGMAAGHQVSDFCVYGRPLSTGWHLPLPVQPTQTKLHAAVTDTAACPRNTTVTATCPETQHPHPCCATHLVLVGGEGEAPAPGKGLGQSRADVAPASDSRTQPDTLLREHALARRVKAAQPAWAVQAVRHSSKARSAILDTSTCRMSPPVNATSGSNVPQAGGKKWGGGGKMGKRGHWLEGMTW